MLSFSLRDICLHQADTRIQKFIGAGMHDTALLGFSAFTQFIKIAILKSTTVLGGKISHHPGSILPKEALHISPSHQLEQNEARQCLQANTNALHNILVIEFTAKQDHSNIEEKDSIST